MSIYIQILTSIVLVCGFPDDDPAKTVPRNCSFTMLAFFLATMFAQLDTTRKLTDSDQVASEVIVSTLGVSALFSLILCKKKWGLLTYAMALLLAFVPTISIATTSLSRNFENSDFVPVGTPNGSKLTCFDIIQKEVVEIDFVLMFLEAILNLGAYIKFTKTQRANQAFPVKWVKTMQVWWAVVYAFMIASVEIIRATLKTQMEVNKIPVETFSIPPPANGWGLGQVMAVVLSFYQTNEIALYYYRQHKTVIFEWFRRRRNHHDPWSVDLESGNNAARNSDSLAEEH